jgi:hypothetical protein
LGLLLLKIEVRLLEGSIIEENKMDMASNCGDNEINWLVQDSGRQAPTQ